MRYILALVGLLFSATAQAQYLTPAVNSPLFPSTPSAGNIPIASGPSAADWGTQSAFLDFIGSTRGSILERGSGGWVTIVPNATAGLPFVSAGAGADPLYQLLGVAGGGTGINVYVVGDILTAATTTTLSKVADVATGNVLRSGGIGVIPAWGKVALGTDVSGTLPIANGGTGQATQQAAFDALAPTATRAGDISYWNGTHYVNLAGNNSGTNILQENSSGVPSWVAAGAGTVTSVATAGILTGGTITTTGTLNVTASITPQGRLTLVTAVPVMTTTQSAKTTIYYTPYNGNLVPIYDGTNMVPTAVAEVSVATTDTTKNPAAIGASKVNDWFIWNDSGTLRVGHGPDWTSDTARSAGTALVMVNGINLNNASITNGPAAQRGTYVGTTRSNASSQLDWIYGTTASSATAGFFGVWNTYNRVEVESLSADSANSWSVASTTPASHSATNKHSFVSGLAEDTFSAHYHAIATSGAGGFSSFGIGYDVTNAFSGTATIIGANATGSAQGRYATTALGFHAVSPLDASASGTATVFGSNAGTVMQSGLWFNFRM